MKKRNLFLIILLILIVSGILSSLAISQVTKSLGANALGPASCTVPEPQPVNYFTALNSGVRALFIDNYGASPGDPGDVYFSRLVNPGTGLPSVIKGDNNGCGTFFSPQSVLYSDTPTAITNFPNSFAEDVNQPTHFFEIWPGGAEIDIIRTAKDGSSRVVILPQVTTLNGLEQVAFDPINDRVVWSSSQWSTFWRCDRNGLNFAAWAPYRPLGLAYFEDGRLVAFDRNSFELRLHNIGWNSPVSQSLLLPVAYQTNAYCWLSVDNERNQVHIFREGNLHGVWDIATNTFQTRNWTTLPGDSKFQGAYYNNWVYVKVNGDRMLRYNWTTNVEESWDGSTFVH